VREGEKGSRRAQKHLAIGGITIAPERQAGDVSRAQRDVCGIDVFGTRRQAFVVLRRTKLTVTKTPRANVLPRQPIVDVETTNHAATRDGKKFHSIAT
jgi:hypothetical protein